MLLSKSIRKAPARLCVGAFLFYATKSLYVLYQRQMTFFPL